MAKSVVLRIAIPNGLCYFQGIQIIYPGMRKEMSEFVDVMGTAEIASGQMKKVNIGGEEVLLARVGDNFYATQHKCPHMGGPLSMGTLQGTVVTCPLHRSQFDLKDGHVVRWTDWTGLKLSLAKIARAPRPLKMYRVKVEGEHILIESEKVMVTPGHPAR